ncbi:hypothetical protein RYX56_19165 [Alkalihalophilus lindianensis]|uniref:Uncharacterized protein n=1 Tax=Alkalihalophilus lindianensis TaxID=1630542 RepID=A0ABU3XF24_9BACI|nr:hypothetical protein [Alkalihalophilus lindianensis]MDV2686494.1 hypothetical protein [Alkalihalophilus lindianensis]
MDCFCEQDDTCHLKVEGDVGADPIWCDRCGHNFELEEFPITNELKIELMEWATKYGEWIDWDLDKLIPNGVEMEEKHNKQGDYLTEKVKRELKGKYKIRFSTSTMGRSYQNK